MYVRELTVRYRRRRVNALWSIDRIATPMDAVTVLQPLLGHEVVEVCGLLCLSTRHEIVAYHELSRGTIDATVVQPRDVFRTALLAHAAMVVVGHNHPSGDPAPSPDDATVTNRLKQAGMLIGVDLIDHVIVAGDRHYSFREVGLL